MEAPMAKRRTDSNRRDLATWLMMLLPGFMFVGLLAPAAVNVKPKAQEEIGPISFRHFSPRRPIQFSLPNLHGLSESGLEPMFAGARYVVDQAKRVAEFDLKADENEQIVLNEDSVETYVAETLFEAAIDDPQQQLVVNLTPLWDPSVFDVIPDLIDRTGFTMWDDFHGTGLVFPQGPPPGNVIPEPATGGLLAIGLSALAMRRKCA
jgi:hypothetical protein